MNFRVTAPAPNAGYNRTTDWPVAGGSGGGVSVKSTLASGTNQWHPTVAWMMGFVVAELVAFHLLSRFMNI